MALSLLREKKYETEWWLDFLDDFCDPDATIDSSLEKVGMKESDLMIVNNMFNGEIMQNVDDIQEFKRKLILAKAQYRMGKLMDDAVELAYNLEDAKSKPWLMLAIAKEQRAQVNADRSIKLKIDQTISATVTHEETHKIKLLDRFPMEKIEEMYADFEEINPDDLDQVQNQIPIAIDYSDDKINQENKE